MEIKWINPAEANPLGGDEFSIKIEAHCDYYKNNHLSFRAERGDGDFQEIVIADAGSGGIYLNVKGNCPGVYITPKVAKELAKFLLDAPAESKSRWERFRDYWRAKNSPGETF